jgi:hypothetical protein
MKPVRLHFNRGTDKIEALTKVGDETGWGRPMASESTYYERYCFFVRGTSLCGHWLSFWNSLDRKVSAENNCPECVAAIRQQSEQAEATKTP